MIIELVPSDVARELNDLLRGWADSYVCEYDFESELYTFTIEHNVPVRLEYWGAVSRTANLYLGAEFVILNLEDVEVTLV